MGLDMYLSKRTLIGAEYKHRNVSGAIAIYIGAKPVSVKLERLSYIEESIGYWRKSNHIHDWFVKNVQDGVDDCRQADLNLENVKALLSACNSVLADNSKAAEILPTRSGFFFGGTDYDEWYFNEVKRTKEILETVLSENESDEYLTADIVYSSSW